MSVVVRARMIRPPKRVVLGVLSTVIRKLVVVIIAGRVQTIVHGVIGDLALMVIRQDMRMVKYIVGVVFYIR